MANFTLSPNMSLPVPTIGEDPGPDYATNLNASLSLIDAHDHSSGSGVQINPGGLNINSALTFNSNNATDLLSARFTSQSVALSGTDFISFVSGNLYVNDGSGNQIQITSGGGVAGSPGSIGSLTAPASATYSSGSKTFVWASGVSKAAAMDNGGITIRETDVASANGVSIISPSALSANYQLTLPTALPGSTQYVTSSSSGVLTFSTSDQIGAAMTATGSNAVVASVTSWTPTATVANSIANARVRATGTTVVAGGVAISSSCGVFNFNSATLTQVTNFSITVTTTGNPVDVDIISDGNSTTFNSSNFVNIAGSTGSTVTIQFLRDSTVIGTYLLMLRNDAPIYYSPLYSIRDFVAAGTYVYSVKVAINSAQSVHLQYCVLTAAEM